MDEIGDWSVKKLEIIKRYSGAYSGLIRKNAGSHFQSVVFIDGFAGQGYHILRRKDTDQGSLFEADHEYIPKKIEGSPIIALKNNFNEFHFVDMSRKIIKELESCVDNTNKNIHFYPKDANEILPIIFSDIKKRFKSWRGLCLLDPFGAHINWNTIQSAGDIGKMLDLIIHFSIRDIQGNGMPNEREGLSEDQKIRFDEFFGDPSWLDIVYDNEGDGFFGKILHRKRSDAEGRIISFYTQRLQKSAGFNYVNVSAPFINSTGGRQYYLIFASHHERGDEKAKEVISAMKKYG